MILKRLAQIFLILVGAGMAIGASALAADTIPNKWGSIIAGTVMGFLIGLWAWRLVKKVGQL